MGLKCVDCNIRFTDRAYLEYHMKKVHHDSSPRLTYTSGDFESYAIKIGYTREVARIAMRTLGPEASFNDLLGMMIHMQSSKQNDYSQVKFETKSVSRPKTNNGGGNLDPEDLSKSRDASNNRDNQQNEGCNKRKT